MPDGSYLIAFLDTLLGVAGPIVKSLDHEGMRGSTLYDFIAKHNYAVGHVFYF